MLKLRNFKTPYQYFHFNFELNVHPYFKSLDWDFLCFHLDCVSQKWKCEIQSIVMMDTHVHLLFRIPDSKENFFAAELLKKLGLSESEISNSTLVEPIKHPSQYLNTYKYIYQNPVVANLVSRPEDYLYSSLSGLLGKSLMKVNVCDQLGLIQNPMKVLSWLQSDQDFKSSKLKSLRQDSSSWI